MLEGLRRLAGEPLEDPDSGRRVAAARAGLVDRAVAALFGPHAGPGLALVAVGGYGRGQLSPGSDVDLLLLHAEGEGRRAEAAFQEVLYPLWDAGLRVGHAIRTVAECEAEATARLDALAPLLTARLVAGSRSLVDGLREAARGVVRADPAGFLSGLREWHLERGVRAGAVDQTMEPDLKQGQGGLRDVHLLTLLLEAGRDGPPGRPEGGFEPLVRSGLLRASEAAWVRDAAGFLLRAREALHRVTGDPSNRLAAEVHDRVAETLGIGPERGWEPRDLLVRTVAGHGRRVRVATGEALERAVAGHGRRVRVALERAVAGPRPRAGRPLGETTAGGLEAAEPALARALRVFARSAAGGGTVDPGELDGLEGSIAPGADPGRDLRPDRGAGPWPPGTLDAFLSLLAAGPEAVRALEHLDALGVVGRLLPEWEQVRGRPQRDPYHRYPVDVHLLKTLEQASLLLRRPEEPFAAAAAGLAGDPAPLLLGALLHDIGKVGRGGHVRVGEEVAEAALDRMGVGGDLRRDVLFLVREHLLLSDTATRRNLADEDLVLHVAARIQTERRLALLYLLTVADAVATGPTACTPWRLGLVRELVAKVGRAFERGLMDVGRAERVAEAEAAVRAALAGGPEGQVNRFLEAVPPGYLLWVRPEDAPSDLPLVSPRPGPQEARVEVRPGRTEGTSTVVVGAVDRPGLLAAIAGALSLSGLSVVSAQAFTTEDGVALDAFDVRGAFEADIGEDRWRRFRTHLREALAGRADLQELVRRRRSHYRPARDVPVAVRVDTRASDYWTVVEVEAADRVGLLFDVARTLAGLGLDVHSAKVATYGPRVVDVFYVTDAEGTKVEDPGSVRRIEEALRQALEAAPAAGPRSGRR